MTLLPRDGIVVRSILITLLAFLLAGIGALAYTSYVTAQRASQTIETRLNQLLDTVQSTVQIVCFVKDEALAREVSAGLLRNSEVLRVTILVDAETVLVDESKPTTVSVQGAERLPPLEREVTSPFAADKVVGRIRLTPNPAILAAQRADDIQLAVKQLAWQLLLVTAAVVTALILFVVRPISRMSQALHHMDPSAGHRLEVPAGHARTEIGHLVADINALSSHLIAALNEAREARRAAENASAAKSQFLANMSHEIRTPLTAIQGFARMGARDSADPASRANFQRVLDAGTHLLDVINDILDFSKLEAGKLHIDERPLRLADLLSEITALLKSRAAEKGLELNYRLATDLPEWILGDPLRLRQILVNLLSNAIKFSRHGAIDLKVLRAEKEIWFAVRDEGIGMTSEEITRLFRPFEQADSRLTRKHGGTGLGLAISMNLASLMGGTIQVASTQWRGSTFTLQMPLRETTAPSLTAPLLDDEFNLEGKLAGYRILVAEDNDANRMILADLLEEAGAACDFAANGRAALDAVMTAPKAFDIVLMDVQMPEMDGLEAARRIRATAPALPIIGLTAHSLPQDRAACLAAGMKDHVTKPIDPKVLITSILVWSHPGKRHAPAPAPSPVVTLPIDDQPVVAASAPATALIDWAALEKRFRGKQEFITRIVRSTLTQYGTAAEQLRAHASSRDFGSIAFISHQFKSIFGNLSAVRSQALATTVEVAARRSDERALAMAVFLAGEIDAVFEALRRHPGAND